MKSFRELEVWRASMDLVEQVYGLVAEFPREEKYALSDQLRRAAVSIPSNIAEGFGRETHKDFAHFIAQARGSLYEVDTQVELAKRCGFVTDTDGVCETIGKISKMLSSLLRHLKSTHAPSAKGVLSAECLVPSAERVRSAEGVLSAECLVPGAGRVPVTSNAPSTKHQAPGTHHHSPQTRQTSHTTHQALSTRH